MEEQEGVGEEEGKKGGAVEAWIESLLEAEFYTQCECGGSNRCETNMFCIDCMGKAFCEKCKMEGKQHSEHRVIQVYKSSHATCFRKQDIKTRMDISSIQSFINNSHHVIYIRPRKSNGHRNGVQPVNRCVVCSWELKSEGDIYCSISCKVAESKFLFFFFSFEVVFDVMTADGNLVSSD
uniref:Uncharacterized protein n=1 Tax=Kalanchoe fedtschenkoi TaxID=63787 RepID=A0A7N0TPL1_KALFE